MVEAETEDDITCEPRYVISTGAIEGVITDMHDHRIDSHDLHLRSTASSCGIPSATSSTSELTRGAIP